MAVKLLQVLVLGVIAAAVDHDVPVTWLPQRGSLPCLVPAADRIPTRSPPPPLDAEKPRHTPYVWRREDEELKISRVWNNGTLEMLKRRDPEGMYQCSARHLAGSVLGIPVYVKYAYLDNKFSVHPTNSTAWRGQPHVLTCDIISYAPAEVSWIKNRKPLVPDDTKYIFLKNQLLISEVTYEDAGLYRCKATNSILNKSRTSNGGRLTVEDSPGNLELAFLPHVLHESVISAPRWSKVVLSCPFVGDRKPQLLWEFTAPGDTRTSELELTQETLVFPTVELDQEGVYTCRPEGHNDLVKTFNVTITEPVTITHPPESRQAVRASTVRFNCTATGKPTPTLAWYKDGKELELPSSRIQMTVLVDDKRVRQLLIRGVTSDDAGIYQCFARNSASVASAWAVLDVTGAEADAPGALRCWPIDASHVTLKWDKVPHEVIAYTIQTIMPDGTSFPEQPLNNTSKNITVKSPLTPYGFQVRAYIRSPTGMKNAVSDMSETVTCQGQGVPITLTMIGDDDLLVSWQDFVKQYPGVREWRLEHRTENSTEEHSIALEGHIYNYTLKVPPSRSVLVRVLGTRALPWRAQVLANVAWSAPGTARHILAPGEVLATPMDLEVTEVNPRNVTVQWRCDHEQKYSYLVCVSKEGESDDCQESYVTSARISQLEPNTEYEVKIQARLLGKTLAGDFSNPINFTTQQEDDLHYAYSSNGIVVRWRGSGGGVRQVRYSQNLTRPLHAWRELNATQNYVEISGLDPLLPTFVVVSSPGTQRQQVLNVKPRPIAVKDNSNIYLLIGASVGCLLLCLLGAAGVCVWHRRKRTRSPARRSRAFEGADEEDNKLTNVGGRLANGGGRKDAGEPLLNGHVRITENPSQSKTPNGKIRKDRYSEPAFDLARYDKDTDVTVETVLDETAASAGLLLDTSRQPEYSGESPTSFNKLPDDNMNSQLTRVQLDNSKLHPTLQPNG